MNPIEKFADAADPKTRQEVRELLELLDKTTDPLERVLVLNRIKATIEAITGVLGDSGCVGTEKEN